MFPHASPAEIIRADQKDLFYRSALGELVAQVAQGTLGPRRWVAWQRGLQAVADGLYLGITTLGAGQTPGEEFCDLLQVDARTGLRPSWRKRAALVALQTLAPYAYETAVVRAARWAGGGAPGGGALGELARQAASYHLAAFYLFGSYYHVSKRLLGIRYRLLRQRRPGEAPLDYSALGVLIVVQLVLEAVSRARRRRRVAALESQVEPSVECSGKAGPDNHGVYAGASAATLPACMMCLDACVNPTATLCGHVFCWACISEWCEQRPQCPLCRRSSPPQRLYPVYHYSL